MDLGNFVITAFYVVMGPPQKKTREGRLTCPLQYRCSQEGLNGSKVLKPFLLFCILQLSYLRET